LGCMKAPEVVTNLAFGGERGDEVLITLATSAYLLDMRRSTEKTPAPWVSSS
jgi:hypothetical protein